jgi:short-subunit dehydrogenase
MLSLRPGHAILGIAVAVAVAARMRHRRRAFADSTVLVTGGSRGLGLELAREFGRRGARVALCARDAGTLATAREDLEVRGIPVCAIPADLREADAAARVVGAVADR